MGGIALRGPISRAGKVIRWITSDPSFPAKVVRYSIVGAASGLIFAGTTTLLVSSFGINAKFASAGGYIISMPVNFLANRSFSFRSEGRWLGDAVRFCLLHLANMIATASVMGVVVDALGLHFQVGIIGAIVLVPVVNFVVLNSWVFGRKEPPGAN